jgi:hypothetical protein
VTRLDGCFSLSSGGFHRNQLKKKANLQVGGTSEEDQAAACKQFRKENRVFFETF